MTQLCDRSMLADMGIAPGGGVFSAGRIATVENVGRAFTAAAREHADQKLAARRSARAAFQLRSADSLWKKDRDAVGNVLDAHQPL